MKHLCSLVWILPVLIRCPPPPCVRPEPGNLTPVRDGPPAPRLRSVNSYTNIRAATTTRNLNKSLQNLNLHEEGRRGGGGEGGERENVRRTGEIHERDGEET